MIRGNVNPSGWGREEADMAGTVLDLTDATFDGAVAQGVTLVDFWAPWCGPCKMVAPVVEALAEEYKDRIKFVKLDTEANPGVPGSMGVRSIPTLIVFKGRDVVETKVGAGSIDDLRAMLDRALGIKKPGLLAKLFG